MRSIFNSLFKLTALAVMAALLSACPKRDAVKEGDDAASAKDKDADSKSAESEGLKDGESVEGDSQSGLNLPAELNGKVIYFEYDQSDFRADGREVIDAHAKYLAAHPEVKIRLEGHTDERGSREYNIGLGERRSQSVRRAMMLQGVGDSQIQTVSYGEERPAMAGSDDDAQSQNRRVEIVYGN
jgi:peptidoglycan-associated lipoprotein